MNLIDDSSKDTVYDLLRRTPNEFSITLSGTQLSNESVEEIWSLLSNPSAPDLGKQRLLF